MADYNIYIHAIGNSGATNENPTVPWSARQLGAAAANPAASQTSGGSVGGAGANAAFAITRAAGFMQNPDSTIGAAVSSLAKAFPIVAAAYAIVKLGDAIISNTIEFNEIETGDYRAGTQYKNFKTGASVLFHPVSSAIQSFKIQNQWSRENQKLRLQRELLGDSVINSYTNRGV